MQYKKNVFLPLFQHLQNVGYVSTHKLIADCRDPKHQVVQVTKLCMVPPNIWECRTCFISPFWCLES